MQTSGTTPRGAVHAPELAKLAAAPGPFLSLYLETEPAIDNAAQRSLLKWKNLRQDLDGAGVPAGVLDPVESLVETAHTRGRTLAAIADASGLRHVAHLTEPLHRDLARWEPLPRVAPLLEWRQSSPPHVIVLTDREGADLISVRHEDEVESGEAGGASDPLRKSAPGGWSQKRYQQRAENTWEENAGDVATEVTRMAADVDARLIVVAGDVRAVQLLRAALPAELLDIVREMPGGRSPDGSEDQQADDVTRLVATVAAEDTRALLEKFREEQGQHDRAVTGPAATLAALARAQADVLLVHDDPHDERTAWFGPEPAQAAARRADVEAMGVPAAEGRLVDVAIRAALGTGAGLRIVPAAGPLDGAIGAILRWS